MQPSRITSYSLRIPSSSSVSSRNRPFPLDTIKFDSLINFMSTAWECLAAEGPHSRSKNSPDPSESLCALVLRHSTFSGSPNSALSPLTGNERQALRDAGGVFPLPAVPHPHRDGPSHSARNCPGDPSRGISARYADSAPYIKKEPLAAVTSAELSSCILDNSDDEDDGSNYHGRRHTSLLQTFRTLITRVITPTTLSTREWVYFLYPKMVVLPFYSFPVNCQNFFRDTLFSLNATSPFTCVRMYPVTP